MFFWGLLHLQVVVTALNRALQLNVHLNIDVEAYVYHQEVLEWQGSKLLQT